MHLLKPSLVSTHSFPRNNTRLRAAAPLPARLAALSACALTALASAGAKAPASASASIPAPASASAPAPARPPNIVFIFSDDHAWQAVSAYGEARRLNDTPNIDRIAKNGMRFDRCLVTNSICGPSRATVLTGVYSHINGFFNNTNCIFDGSQITFPKLLQAAGYQTAIVGKWHLESNPTGFDFWQILVGQGKYFNPPMIRNGAPVSTKGYVTDIIADITLDWLKNKRDPNRPFLLMMHNKAPHRIWMPDPRDLNFDHDRVYPEPPTLFDDYAGRGAAERQQKMTIARFMDDRDLKLKPDANLPKDGPERAAWDAYYNPRNEAFQKARLTGNALTSWKYQRYMHDYLATIHRVDIDVGRVLDYLEQNGLSENTIIVYSSDQGFYLGEHGWFDKRWIFEESLRAPLLISWAGVTKPGSTSDQIVSNLDFAQTFLDAAGVPAPARMQGRSFVPLLKGERPADWRAAFYYEYYEYPAPHHVAPQYGVITDRYKLVHMGGPDYNYWEMFDLQTDPAELTSIYNNPAYVDAQKKLEADLSRLRKELQVPAQTPRLWYGNGTGRENDPKLEKITKAIK